MQGHFSTLFSSYTREMINTNSYAKFNERYEVVVLLKADMSNHRETLFVYSVLVMQLWAE